VLLEKGMANPALMNYDKWTPISLATKADHKAIVAILSEHLGGSDLETHSPYSTDGEVDK
jgi:ankyrin repeat protein